MPPIIKKLGFIKAIYNGSSSPINIKMLWYDENIGVAAVDRLKYFNIDSSSWISVTAAGGGGVPSIPLDKIVVGSGPGIQQSGVSVSSDDDLYDVRDLLILRHFYLKSTVFPTTFFRMSYEGNPAPAEWKIPTSQPTGKFLKTGDINSEELEWSDPDNFANADLTFAANRTHDVNGNESHHVDGAFDFFSYVPGGAGKIRLMHSNGSVRTGMKTSGNFLEVGVFDDDVLEDRQGVMSYTPGFVAPYKKLLHASNARHEHSYSTSILGVGQNLIVLEGCASSVTVSGDQAQINWTHNSEPHATNAFGYSLVRIDNSGGHTLSFINSRWQMSSGDSAPVLGTGIHWLWLLYDPISERQILVKNIEIATDL